MNWEYFSIFQDIFQEDKTMNTTPVVYTEIPSQIHTNLDSSNGICSTSSIDTDLQVEPLVSPGHSTHARHNVDVPASKRKKQNDLDRFRKRQLEIEDKKLEELKKLRECMEENNKLQKEKIDVIKKLMLQ